MTKHDRFGLLNGRSRLLGRISSHEGPLLQRADIARILAMVCFADEAAVRCKCTKRWASNVCSPDEAAAWASLLKLELIEKIATNDFDTKTSKEAEND